jgi:hypothetical protein
VLRDDHRSSFHDMLHFRYDEHRPALHVEGLNRIVNNVRDENVVGMCSIPIMHSFHTLCKDCTRITTTNSKTIDASHKSNPSSILLGYVDSNSILGHTGGGNSCGVYTLYRVTTTHAG